MTRILCPPDTSQDFDRMRPGCVGISVPLHNDVIQLSIVEPEGTGRLLVEKTDETITIARADGHQIQAEKVSADWSEGGGSRVVRTQIFTEPFDRLHLGKDRTPGAIPFWHVTDSEVRVVSQYLFEGFISKVGMYALLRQQDEVGFVLR